MKTRYGEDSSNIFFVYVVSRAKHVVRLICKGRSKIKAELLKGLTNEQIAKIRGCKSQEENLSIAKEEGIELNDEQLDAVPCGNCLANNSLR